MVVGATARLDENDPVELEGSRRVKAGYPKVAWLVSVVDPEPPRSLLQRQLRLEARVGIEPTQTGSVVSVNHCIRDGRVLTNLATGCPCGQHRDFVLLPRLASNQVKLVMCRNASTADFLASDCVGSDPSSRIGPSMLTVAQRHKSGRIRSISAKPATPGQLATSREASENPLDDLARSASAADEMSA